MSRLAQVAPVIVDAALEDLADGRALEWPDGLRQLLADHLADLRVVGVVGDAVGWYTVRSCQGTLLGRLRPRGGLCVPTVCSGARRERRNLDGPAGPPATAWAWLRDRLGELGWAAPSALPGIGILPAVIRWDTGDRGPGPPRGPQLPHWRRV